VASTAARARQIPSNSNIGFNPFVESRDVSP
jgi:hypothetical protein